VPLAAQPVSVKQVNVYLTHEQHKLLLKLKERIGAGCRQLVLEQLQRTRQRFIEFGIDYSGTFYHGGRTVSNVNLMLYNGDDADLTARTRGVIF
jgi:hypothetical protein